MIAVIFEAYPAEGRQDEYFDIAAGLKPRLAEVKGFISIERFQSIADSGKILSLSFWEDEESIKEWRNNALHRAAQQEGRNSIFHNYRLRIADVKRDYGMNERGQAPDDSTLTIK